jgi:hypothetical protein
VKAFRCRVCDHPLHFENTDCVSCGSTLGFVRDEQSIVPVIAGRYVDAAGLVWYPCANRELAGCPWLSWDGPYCSSCTLTRTRPNDTDEVGLAQFVEAERAKRHLLVELDTLGFRVVGKDVDPENGLAFDLLSSVADDVTIGHADGVITIDLAESDPSHREAVRERLSETYRTMLGHFRHEFGHYAEWQLVRGDDLLTRCRELFGDESADYQEALDRHYEQGPPAAWEEHYLSAYATMHPFEDFAETWAHYLHICDAVETAREYGLLTVGGVEAFSSFRDLVTGVWVPLSIALNQMNRSLGQPDLYPFVIPPPVLDKLDFVAGLLPRMD